MSVSKHHSPVVVTGMHRSGTSMVASILAASPIDMGREMLAADSNNVLGYFEDVEFLRLQRTILSACCKAGDGGHPDWGWTESESLDYDCFKTFLPEASALIASRSDRRIQWGWKDPRTSLLLDFWDQLLGDARYVFVYRYPWDVADSMQRLGAEVFLKNPEYGYRIWAFYNRHIRDFYLKHPGRCLLVSTNALEKNHSEFARLISTKLGIPLTGANSGGIQDSNLFKATVDFDPLIGLAEAVWPACTQLLAELDDLADISSAGLWRVRPLRRALARPDTTAGTGSIDVSVVIPCYNQGVFLVEAIASVERCAPSNCEIIIVNDGSEQPRTLEILGVLRQHGYHIVDQPNLGLSAARNAAIAVAQGRHILPLDSDNRIRPNFIRDAIRVLDASPDAGVVYGDRYDFGLRAVSHQIPEFDLTRMLKMNYIDACAVFRKQVWRDCGGYDSRMSPMEDWELWIHAAELGWQFHHLPYLTFDYRVRPASLISNFQSIPALQEFRERILLKHPKSHVDLAELFRALDRLSSERPIDQEQMDLLSSKLAAGQEHIKSLSATVDQMKEQIQGSARTIQSLKSDAVVSEQQRKAWSDRISALSKQVADRDAQLAKIRGSRGYRLLESYGRIKYRHLLPIYRLLGLSPKGSIEDCISSHKTATEGKNVGES